MPSRFAAECGIPNGLGLLLRSGDATEWHGYHLEEPYALIGSAEDCNVRLSDEGIAPFHAYMQMLNDRLFLCDLTERRGVLVDDYSVTAEWVDRQSHFQVGPYELRVDAMDQWQAVDEAETDEPERIASDVRPDVRPFEGEELDEEASEPASGVMLSMQGRGGRLHRVHSQREISLVGRSPACKFTLGSSSVANYHCSLVRTSASVWVIDLGAHKGTHLNGHRVRSARVPHGARLKVGRCRLNVDLQSVEEDEHASDSGSRALIPTYVDPPREETLVRAAGTYSEDLIRELVDDVASSQQVAFEQARAMLVELVSAQERMHANQLEAAKEQNSQLLEVIRMLTGSQNPPLAVANLPAPAPANAPTPEQASAAESPDEQQPTEDFPPNAPEPDRDADPEIHDAWVRGQLHIISENLKNEQERGVKKLLRGLIPGKSDDALR